MIKSILQCHIQETAGGVYLLCFSIKNPTYRTKKQFCSESPFNIPQNDRYLLIFQRWAVTPSVLSEANDATNNPTWGCSALNLLNSDSGYAGIKTFASNQSSSNTIPVGTAGAYALLIGNSVLSGSIKVTAYRYRCVSGL